MLKYVFFTMIIIASNLFGQISPGPYDENALEWPYYINAIPFSNYSFAGNELFNNYSFDSREQNQFFSSNVTILGWSRDGKILIFDRVSGNQGYEIIDLVEDKLLFNSYHDWYRRNTRPIEESEPSVVREYVLDIARRYNIEPILGEIGMFPYMGNDGIGYNISIDETPADDYHTRITAYIYREAFPDKRKLLNIIGEQSFWNELYRRKLTFWYAKSPFENRIAVIAALPLWIDGAYDTRYYKLKIFGSHLNVGF
jgi:hypothetical protein